MSNDIKYLIKVIATVVAAVILVLLFSAVLTTRTEKAQADSPRGIWYKERPFTMDDGTPCTVIWWNNAMEATGVTCDYSEVTSDD